MFIVSLKHILSEYTAESKAADSVFTVGTFGIVVEDTVVSTSVRMGVPERGGTATERRKLYFLLRQSLFRLCFQSINVPAEFHSHLLHSTL